LASDRTARQATGCGAQSGSGAGFTGLMTNDATDDGASSGTGCSAALSIRARALASC
jgi:hypothetical protein